MKYTPELEQTIERLEIRKDEILFLTIENVYLDEMKAGEKDIEHRAATQFMLSRLFKKNKEGMYTTPKKKTHILFQAGYNLDSRRMLVELISVEVGYVMFPPATELNIFPNYDSMQLYLGKIEYDSGVPVREKSKPKKQTAATRKPQKKTSKTKDSGIPKLRQRRVNSKRARKDNESHTVKIAPDTTATFSETNIVWTLKREDNPQD